MKPATVVVVVAVAAGGLVWMSYGTVHPCGMLKQDLRAALLGPAKTTPPGSTAADALQRLGRALGTTIMEPAIDLALKDRTPVECLRRLARLHLGRAAPEDVLLGR